VTRLLEFNTRWSGSRALWRWSVAAFLGALMAYLLSMEHHGAATLPPQVGDGPDYDAIAFQLWKGHGFSVDWDDPEFRAPYSPERADSPYRYLLTRHGTGPTTYRPPALPVLMAASYAAFGREFLPVRVLIAVSMALACAVIFWLVARRAGVLPGVLFFCLFVLADHRSKEYSCLILTEGPACLAAALLACACIRCVDLRTAAWAVVAGLLGGVAVLVRSAFVVWLPALAGTIWLLTGQRSGTPSRKQKPRLVLCGVFLVAAALVQTPWALRNCWLLQGFRPLGTQGDIGLGGAYNDTSFERGGQWVPADQTGLFAALKLEALSTIAAENAAASHSRVAALSWITQHPWKAIGLAFLRAHDLWRPRRPNDSLIFLCAVLGVMVYPARSECSVLVAAIAANTLGVAIAWGDADRFLLPVAAPVCALAAVGLWSILHYGLKGPGRPLQPTGAADRGPLPSCE
jgi:4-amino-4-deoxy-L-arabinose transferase-like glycosyltransferase